MIKFNYELANDAQKVQLVAFKDELKEKDLQGDNIGFAEVLGEIAKYQRLPENSNIWVDALHPCCEGRNGSFYKEIQQHTANFLDTKGEKLPKKNKNKTE